VKERGISTVGVVAVAVVVTVVTVATAVSLHFLLGGPAGGLGGGTPTPTMTTTHTTTTTPTHTLTSTTTTPTHTTTTTTTITPVTYSGGTIRIDSDDKFTSANGVVSGSGTQADPYIIEGWTIDASSCDTSVWPYIKVGIIVSYTSKYFVIRNCRVENAGEYGTGISLGVDLSNGSVQSCVVRKSGTGISFGGCSNVVISGNTIENCGCGIGSGGYSSDGITISNNTITGCTDVGINFHYIYNSSASGNTVTNNSYGISVFDASACTISNNIVQGNATGIGVGIDMGGFENNTISYNNTSNNGGTGIGVTCSNNTISHNTSNGNGYRGISLDFVALTDITASYNIVSNNTASNNGMGGLYAGSGCAHNTISNNTCLSNNTLGQYYYVCTNPECLNYTDTSKEGKIFPTDQTCILCGGPISKIPQGGCHDLEINYQPNTLENNIYETSYIE
jgi:parallel beta-helix repeat protein